MKFILGKKIGMGQVFNNEGKVIPVTWIEAGPCFITKTKKTEKDGYEAIQIGFEKKKKNIKKTEKSAEYKYLKEFRKINGLEDKIKKGEKLDVSIFSENDPVKISGVSKAKGFQGVVKRWNFKGAPKSHGTKHNLRRPGSIGSTDNARVFKGKKMAGRMGGRRISVLNLKVVKVDAEKNLISVNGAVPGRKGTLLELVSNK